MPSEDASDPLLELRGIAAIALAPTPVAFPEALRRRIESLVETEGNAKTIPAETDSIATEIGIDGFALEAEVGRGGMGAVYSARDLSLSRRVAVKILSSIADSHQLERFQREVQAAAGVRHDHLIPVYSTGRTTAGRPYLVMPLIAGGTLRARLKNEMLPPSQTASIIREVALGLSALHAAGILHRDIKPANILLDSSDGRAKLTDFGLARGVQSDGLTVEGAIVGTPEFMSPEQATSPESLDERSDIYSLGVTLYECLAGTIPFRGAPLEIIRQRGIDDPESPRRFNSKIPKDLETICLKATAREPNRRYSTAAALADDLERWSLGKPIAARPIGRVERAVRWMRRNPLPVVILAITISGAVASGLGWSRAAASADLAEERRRAAEQSVHAEAKQRERAEQHLATARAAVDRFYVRVMDEGLLKDPQLQPQRREILADTAKFYSQMLALESADSTLRRPAIHTAISLGLIQRDLGQWDEAEASLRKAVQMAREEVAANSGDFSSKTTLAKSLNTLRIVMWGANQFEAIRELDRESVELHEELVAIEPDNLMRRRDLAAMRANMASAALVRGDQVAAHAELLKARYQIQELVRLKPDESIYKADLARIENNLGFGRDSNDDALGYWERARAMRRELLRANSTNAVIGFEFVKNCHCLAIQRLTRSEWSEVLAVAQEGIAQARITLKGGSHALVQNLLADLHGASAESFKQLGQNEKADLAYREARAELCKLMAADTRVAKTFLEITKAHLEFLRGHNRVPEAEIQRQLAWTALDQLSRAKPNNSAERAELSNYRKALDPSPIRESPPK